MLNRGHLTLYVNWDPLYDFLWAETHSNALHLVAASFGHIRNRSKDQFLAEEKACAKVALIVLPLYVNQRKFDVFQAAK